MASVEWEGKERRLEAGKLELAAGKDGNTVKRKEVESLVSYALG